MFPLFLELLDSSTTDVVIKCWNKKSSHNFFAGIHQLLLMFSFCLLILLEVNRMNTEEFCFQNSSSQKSILMFSLYWVFPRIFQVFENFPFFISWHIISRLFAPSMSGKWTKDQKGKTDRMPTIQSGKNSLITFVIWMNCVVMRLNK